MQVTSTPSPSAAESRSLYTDAYPEGWYPLVRSFELRKGQRRALDVLGRQLVVFRAMSGQAAVMDRFCPHMGASLAQGTVKGERIVCPFHNWEYDVTGRCRHVPYLDRDTVPKSAVVPTLRAVERFGFVWAYYGGEPTHELPDIPEYGSPGWSVRSRTFHLAMHPLLTLENAADLQHFKYVHRVNFTRLEVEMLHDEPHRFEFAAKHHATGGPFPFLLPCVFNTQIRYVGASAIFGRIEVGKFVARFIAAPVPEGPRQIQFHFTTITKNLPRWLSLLNPLYAEFMSRQICHGATDDYETVWRHMNPDRRRVLVADDRLQQRFRAYYRAHLPGRAAAS
jgi:phenylpropionate dioxygenase-like ring-hydroxylating dioxygenase large terminal subunit